jgi:type I restriction enzyme R subunit
MLTFDSWDRKTQALEARMLRDTYHYFGCEPGQPTFRYDIIDAAQDPAGPFLCMPKIFDIRSDITTQALEEKGWAVTIDEQTENFKIQDLERKIFTPARNALMCKAFLEHAQSSPDGRIGKSIVFAINQNHATELTQLLNSMQPELAVTITSRIPESSAIAKDFRDSKRKERVAVSVDMLSTGYNCKDLLNVVLMRPIFSPTEYIQIKGRGTRIFTFRIGHTEYAKKVFFLLDFCGVAEYFEEKYDYTLPLQLPQEKTEQGRGSPGSGLRVGGPLVGDVKGSYATGDAKAETPGIPVWQGIDTIVSKEIYLVGPNGEKVDQMTFRGSFERDVAAFAQADPEFRQAVETEDDDAVETILQERFFHKPEMYYSPDKLVLSYGVPAPTPSFAYHALGIKPLPSKDRVVQDTVDSLAARFNLRYSEQQWLAALAMMVVDDPDAREKFLQDDPTLFMAGQFTQMGGVSALTRFTERASVFEALRQSSLVRQAVTGGLAV